MKTTGTKVGSVFIDVTANTDRFRQSMAKIDAQAKTSSAAIRNTMNQAASQTRLVGSSMATSMNQANGEAKNLMATLLSLKNILIAVAAGAGAKAYTDIADEFSLMRSRIRLVTQEGENLYEIEDKLARQAFVNRASLKETVALYTRLRQSREDLSDAATQNLVDKWSKTLIISASSATEAASSTMQFAQAMSAGVLAGQELRSVIQGNSAFAVSLAKGLGVTTGALKQMGEEGKLTTDVIIEAINKAGDSIEHDFSKKALTVHQAMTNMETATLRVLGSIDQAFGLSSANAEWINSMAQALDDLTAAMGGPIKQAEVAAERLNMTNTAIKADTESLAGLHEKLTEAIRDGGDAAEIAARQEIDAVNQRIVKNKELAQVYLAQARAKLAEAKAELDNKTNIKPSKWDFQVSELARRTAEVPLNSRGDTVWNAFSSRAYQAGSQAEVDKRFGDPMKRLDDAMAQIARMQDANQPLSQAQNNLLDFAANIADLQTRIALADEQIELLTGGGILPIAPPGAPPAGGATTGPDPAAILDKQLELELARARGQDARVAQLEDELAVMQLTTQLIERGMKAEEASARAVAHVSALRRAQVDDVEVLAGYTTELEELNAELLEIEKARAEGSTNSSRAAMQAMLDYLNATDDVATVLGKIRDLSGDLLSPEDAAALKALADAVEAMQWDKMRADIGDQNAIDDLARNAPDVVFADNEFERRMSDAIANATKQGLIWGIETGNWGDVFAGILTDIVRESLSSAMDVLFDALSQIDWGSLFNGVSSGTGWAGLFTAMGAGFMGAGTGAGMSKAAMKSRAGGGPVSAGDMVRVGELGSEWFVPNKDGFIIPAGGMKARSAIMPVSIGETHLHVNGLANGVTTDQLAAALDAHRRALPAAIDRRVADRLQRGAY